MKNMWRLDILAQDEDFDRITGILTLCVSFGWEEESLSTGETRFRVHCEHSDFMRDLQRRIMTDAPEAQACWKDWMNRIGWQHGGSFLRRFVVARASLSCPRGWNKARIFLIARMCSLSLKALSAQVITPPQHFVSTC